MKKIIIGVLLVVLIGTIFFLSEKRRTRLVIKIPYKRQFYSDGCASACLQMVFSYWGKDINQEEIYSDVDKGKPALLTDMIKYAEELGYLTYTYSSKIDDIKSQIKNKFPLIVLQKVKNSPHARVVIGYDERKKIIIVNDPGMGEEYEISYFNFVKDWQSNGNLTLLIIPKHKGHYVKKETAFPYAAIYHSELANNYYLNEHDLDKAIIEFEKAIKVAPNYAMAHLGLGFVYVAKEWYDKAVVELKETIRIFPDNALAHCGLGTIYNTKGRYTQAISEHVKAIQINPDLSESHYGLGVAYGNRKLYDKAISEFKKTIDINPDDMGAHYRLGVAYLHKVLYDEATVEFKKVIEKDMNNVQAHLHLGFLYFKKRLIEDALIEYNQVIRLGPETEEAKLAREVVNKIRARK